LRRSIGEAMLPVPGFEKTSRVTCIVLSVDRRVVEEHRPSHDMKVGNRRRHRCSPWFEVRPEKEKFELYLDLAKGLKPILEGVDGFIDNERFESTRRPGWIFSHSTWRDEKSVVRWRTVAKHYETQQRGRDEVFQDYHLRVREIVLDTAPPRGKFPLAERGRFELPRSFSIR
jgi:heme-degrading monooxygenase HmoA